MSSGTRATTLRLLAMAAALVCIVVSGVFPIGLLQAAFFGAGALVAAMLLIGSCREDSDGLYAARMQLARFRRSGDQADLLVVKLPATTSIPGKGPSRTRARAVWSVLRVTDGVSTVPALSGNGLCAVLRADAHTRTAVERRVRDACAGEVQITWASSPEDGVTLDSLLEEALNHLRDTEPAWRQRPSLRTVPVHRLVPRGLGGERDSMRTAR